MKANRISQAILGLFILATLCFGCNNNSNHADSRFKILVSSDSDEYYNEDGRYDDAWKERSYKYGSNYIETCDGELWEFYIYDTKFKVLTTYFDGGIGVGDHISVFKGFKDGMLYQRDPKRFGEYCYEIEDSSDGYFCFSTDTKGYITSIWYTFPV